MKNFQAKRKETEELKQLYKILQQEWDACQQSKSTTASREYPAPSKATITKAIQLHDKYPPRDLMYHLQQDYSSSSCSSSSSSPAEAWKEEMMMRTKDVAAQETLRERMEAIESGKLKGRRLFQRMEGESDSENETTDMGPHCEVRSLSFYCSEDEDESCGSSKGQHHCTKGCSYSSSSSSSSPCLSGSANSVDNDQEAKRVALAKIADRRVAIGRPGNGARYVFFIGGLAIALLVIAMCMSSVRTSGGCDYEVIQVPT